MRCLLHDPPNQFAKLVAEARPSPEPRPFPGTEMLLRTAAGLLLATTTATAADSCVWDKSPSGASFDLSALKQTFTVTGGDIDCTEVVEQDYSYAFNLCGTVDASALGSAAPATCSAATSGDTATVLQYDSKAGSCKGAGRSGTQAWSLVDPNDRSKA